MIIYNTIARLLNYHKNNSTGNNSTNIANEKAFVNRTMKKILCRNKKKMQSAPIINKS